MTIDLRRLDLELARNQKSISNLREGVSPQTLRKISRGESVRPAVVGRIAAALGVDVSELLEDTK